MEWYGATCEGCLASAKAAGVCYLCWGTAVGGHERCPACDGTGSYTEGTP